MQLMWVSGPTGRVRKISITLRTVSIAVGILAALLVAAGGILHFVGLRIAIEARPDLARAMGGVLTQAEQDQIEQAYKERLQAIQEKLQTTSDEIIQIQKLKDKFMDMATPSVAISGKAYCLPPIEMNDGSYQWMVGSSYDEHEEDLNVWQKSHQENLSLIQEMLGKECDLAEIEPLDAFVGIRCVASDRLPIMGPVKGYPGLYILTSLGSRGVMWSALAHQMFTEHLAEEIRQSAFLDARFFAGARLAGLGLSEDLVSALLPARFLAGASNSKPILPSA
jgi:glycine/D-amino acid oxidase-like deaminating enzyme